jgi:hypothetical protein
MYKNIKTLLQELLETKVPAIRKIDWYNQQYLNTEKQKAINYPAVYIEVLDPQNWEDASAGLQVANMRIKLHIVDFDLKDDPEDIMDLTQTVFLAVQGVALYDFVNDIQVTSKMVRVATEFTTRYNQLKRMSLTLNFAYFDYSSAPIYIQTPGATSLGITTTLD